MSSLEVPSQSTDTIKVPTAHYEFGANFLDPKVCFIVFHIMLASTITMHFLTFFKPLFMNLSVVNAHWKGDD
jgi:hypothetical protein